MKELYCLTRFVALRFENLVILSRYFYKSKDLSQRRWFGHVSRMPQERLPKQALLAKAIGRKQMGKDQSDDLELSGPITLRILNGFAGYFTQAK